MKFYNRTEEIKELKRIQNLAFEDYSKLTVITGRRRIGKTVLAAKACEKTPTAYLFVAKKSEAMLCKDFIEEISNSLGIFIPQNVVSFPDIFRLLLIEARDKRFNLIIDEFHNFYKINPSVYSDMQNIWDRYRKSSHINLIVCGSVYSLMHKIFEQEQEPLFGRQDNTLRLQAFDTKTLKKILKDYSPSYSNEDLLALYAFTGGIPKYVELFMDNRVLTKDAMIEFMIRRDSPFVNEGRELLIEEFGKDYGLYFSILSAISSAVNTQAEIESLLGGVSIGGNLKRLIEDYNVISRKTPLGSKPGAKAIRYIISDNFLNFWFKYIHRRQAIIEIGNYPLLQKIVKEDYPTYTGHILERWFRKKMSEEMKYRAIGTWWDPSDKENQSEIDIVCLDAHDNHKAFAWEVKRNPDRFSKTEFKRKADRLQAKTLKGYNITLGSLSMKDM